MRITAPPKKVSPPLPSSLLKKKKQPEHPLPETRPKNFKLAAPAEVVEILIYLLKAFGLRMESNSSK